MEIKKLQSAIEAILFASGDAVQVDRLGEVLSLDRATLLRLLDSLVEKYKSEDTGLQIIKLEDSYQMAAKEEHADLIRAYLDMRRNVPLSNAAMEVLAIVAYNQPVTRAFIEQIRGVDCAAVVGSLVAKDLLEEKGRLELPGRPLLYGTTSHFLRCFGISSLDELPALPQREEPGDGEESGPLLAPDTPLS